MQCQKPHVAMFAAQPGLNDIIQLHTADRDTDVCGKGLKGLHQGLKRTPQEKLTELHSTPMHAPDASHSAGGRCTHQFWHGHTSCNSTRSQPTTVAKITLRIGKLQCSPLAASSQPEPGLPLHPAGSKTFPQTSSTAAMLVIG